MNHGIHGAHWILHSRNAEVDRAFFRDVLGLPNVDAGGGWLIFALPPSEVAVHPGDGEFSHAHEGGEVLGSQLFLMCSDLNETIASLSQRGVDCAEPRQASWGRHTLVRLPSGGSIGLYEPNHPTAIARSH